ncbi:GDSL-type esterase/lipase family protein [Arthrobacter sp. H14]|uniref:GDSL-type esterase/lipase family protein n=1 Tax=Arthrobacter sp. H14 TaxID=1312959 RepID=UPI00047C41A7|nr:GDSL-type esterase/lipase family protein [Arthrobacter sp. H14]
MEQRRIRIAAVGDELLAGSGDQRALGWFGRVLARTTDDAASVEAFPLAVPEEGTEALAARWLQEAERRFDERHENRLVIGLSDRDLDLEISPARSRLNLANILDGAAQLGVKVFVVGPPPGLNPERNKRLGELSAAYGDVTTRRKHTYVDTYTPLLNHEQWRTDLAGNGGVPGQAGHGLIAWLVLHRGWFTWLDLPEGS